MQVENVKVNMLGSFSVCVNGCPVVENAAKITKPWQLFCYLVLNREKFISNRKLIATLWADDVLADPANVLKNAVYSLRKELCGGESLTESPIIYSTGGYRFDPAVEIDLDVDRFDEQNSHSRDFQLDAAARIEYCRQALQLYKGDFLPQLDQDLWAVPLALNYKQKYIHCAHHLCEYLWQKRQHEELLEVASTANALDLLDEKSIIFLFRALDALRMYRVIVTTYSKVAQGYTDALGSTPPAEAVQIYQAASDRINKTEQDIIVIKTELAGIEQSVRPQRGAYFCSYSHLKHMYPLLKRAADRNRQTLVMALFTLVPIKGSTSDQYDLTRAMAEFKVIAMNALRKADTMSRYSRNQYVILLSISSLEDGRFVRDRIRESFSHTAASHNLSIDAKLTEV